MATPDDQPLENAFDRALDGPDGDSVSIGEVLSEFGDRSFGSIFTFLGLLTVIPPLGGIPGLPAMIGLILLLFSIQMVSGRKHIWLPSFLSERSISKAKIRAAHDRSESILKAIDGVVTDRFEWAVSGKARYGAAVLVSLLALFLIPLELVPFAVALPGAAITFIGLGLLARDGALMLLAYTLSAAAGLVLIRFLRA